MVNRVLLLAFGLFWLTMTVLLWRSEVSEHSGGGSEVPLKVVWQKILTAPDNSNLEIFYQKKRIGYSHWSANIGEEKATGKALGEDSELVGQVQQLTGYTLDFDGTLYFQERTNRYRFFINARFNTNDLWQEFTFKVIQRPTMWEVRSDAVKETVRFNMYEGDEVAGREFTFAQLQHPERLLAEVGGPLLPPLLAGNPLVVQLGNTSSAAANLHWHAYLDWMSVGFARFRVYRLEAEVMDRQRITIYISKVGEILKVELPNHVLLVNDEMHLM